MWKAYFSHTTACDKKLPFCTSILTNMHIFFDLSIKQKFSICRCGKVAESKTRRGNFHSARSFSHFCMQKSPRLTRDGNNNLSSADYVRRIENSQVIATK